MVAEEQLLESCFAAHLGYYLSLTEAESACVARLESALLAVGAREQVQRRGDTNRQLYVVQSGWLYTSIELPGGRREVLQIHNAGDIIGLQNMAFHWNVCDLTAFEACRLCPFPADHIGHVLQNFPRLAALLLAIAAREQVVINDLKSATARLRASDRVLYLLLILLSRLQITNRAMTSTMRFPMSQSHIGDAVGLTSVSVSKAMARLESDGVIARASNSITVIKLSASIARLDFQNRFDTLDTGWFPPAAAATGVRHPAMA